VIIPVALPSSGLYDWSLRMREALREKRVQMEQQGEATGWDGG